MTHPTLAIYRSGENGFHESKCEFFAKGEQLKQQKTGWASFAKLPTMHKITTFALGVAKMPYASASTHSKVRVTLFHRKSFQRVLECRSPKITVKPQPNA
jgi:hypothetical protein